MAGIAPDRAAAAGDADKPISFQRLVQLNTHLSPGSDYHRVFFRAARATSPDEPRRNQTLKFLRQAGLYQTLMSVVQAGVIGPVAECGSFRGHSAHMMAEALRGRGITVPLHLFDSGEGLSEFGASDLDGVALTDAQIARKRHQFAVPQGTLAMALAPFSDVHVHLGWIPARFGDVADLLFSLVHIDVDLFQPTHDSLAFFYPRLMPGGRIVVDDYNSSAYPGCNRAVDDFVANHRPPVFMPFQVGGCVIGR